MSNVILEVLQQMAVDATDATHLIERAYAAGVRAGQQQASADLSLGLELARVELAHERIDSLTARIDTLADTTNKNMGILAESVGSVLLEPEDKSLFDEAVGYVLKVEGIDDESEAIDFVRSLNDDSELHAFVEHCRKQHEQG